MKNIKTWNQCWSLRTRIMVGLISYQILLTLAILMNDFVVNEQAEALVWQTSLNKVMDQFIHHRTINSDGEQPTTKDLSFFRVDASNPRHQPLAALKPGLHDEFIFEGKQCVVLIRVLPEGKFALLLQIDDLEHREAKVRGTILISAAIVSLLLCLLIAWAVGWLIHPLRMLANQIQLLSPDQPHQRIHLTKNASTELEIIAEAMNKYIERNTLFLERERDFINMTSHELRTPLAVIDGITKLALDDVDISQKTKNRLMHIQDAMVNVNDMVALLLVLAKDPARLSATNEMIFLDKLLWETLQEHQAFAAGENITLVAGQIETAEIMAPMQMVKCALGNLLRNAIEHSHGGTIIIDLTANAMVTIKNTASGMSLQEVSEIYTRLARNNGRNGGGIGLDLISRLCNHCNWSITFASDAGLFSASIKFQPV